ncbi:MAG TPA: alternative ribosome rescue aminoacyl-tRNA hydrolase ArfB [Candidatus Babeliales bacterium]|nr:alternative ribosome rescue aminoacyl-tRNA hydrolase ArfB [Candidatus Babeliales bacterium]
MENDLLINNWLTIPGNEIEVTASRSGGAGGQHVNKTNSKITIRWNVPNSLALTESQKIRILQKLSTKLTSDGDLIIHDSTTRSQHQNKEQALGRLAEELRQALHVPKKRMRTRVSPAVKEARLRSKNQRSEIKKMRSKKNFVD